MSDKPNRLGVKVQYLVYRDSNMLNEKGVITRLVTMENLVITGSLHTFPEVHKLFNLHRFY